MKCAGCFKEVPYAFEFVVVVPWMPVDPAELDLYARQGCFMVPVPESAGDKRRDGLRFALTYLCDECFEQEVKSQLWDRRRAAVAAERRRYEEQLKEQR